MSLPLCASLSPLYDLPCNCAVLVIRWEIEAAHLSAKSSHRTGRTSTTVKGMEHDEIASRLDRLNADLSRLEDSISTVYEEVLRLRADISGTEPRGRRWEVSSVKWFPPMPD